MRNINLLPSQYRPTPQFVIKRFVLTLFAVIFILSIVTAYITLKVNIATIDKLIENKERDIQILENNLGKVAENREHLQKVKKMVNTIEEIEKTAISHQRVLEQLAVYIPQKVVLNSVSISGDTITLYGQAPDLTTVSLLLDSLNSWGEYSGFFISSLSLTEDGYIFNTQGQWRKGEK
ncbi:Tfp pilus assembly protein PilN [Anaerobranca californiensis DSM 14826]|jgi:Tfp pilus assembly protein PilN|uniref:Tfp pilus assembly protein PilN n=1 Tax=Anaerobranca californiensis DSM 14826 TaxID=1120989 RepID=A0A1M6LBB0_9FIRM|nr:PilN domain-containing protein [Anaerobranca californiensis]SHJ68439.1 Tfp pilus assembly protein PilN [Anaerobranca californiensis DSM 14826]